MARVTFPINSYEIKLARELSGYSGGVTARFPAYVVCNGSEYHAIVYCLHDDSPVPDNTFLPEYKRGTLYVPRWQFEWFRDLLRNEMPVYCTLDSTTPKWNSVYTGHEPTGEGEP
jgi:hypothetical protein